MIYLNLPLLCDNEIFNNTFINYVKAHPNALKLPIFIESNYGALPYSLWNGGFNSNYGKNFLYQDIASLLSKIFAPIRIDFSNILLKENDLFNIHENTILKIFESNGTLIDIGDLNIYNYIQKNYKNYQFTLSSNANMIHPFNEDILNIFLEQEDFVLITLNSNINLDFSKLKHKSKIEIEIGNTCKNCLLEQQECCKSCEMNYQYDFSINTLSNCDKRENFYNDSEFLINEIQKYNMLGITHFKIMPPNMNNIKSFNKFLLLNFIKSEYLESCFNYFNNYAGGTI